MIMITIVTRYSYESTSVEDLYQLVAEETLQHKRRLDNLAFLLSGSEKVVLLCAADRSYLAPTMMKQCLGVVPL